MGNCPLDPVGIVAFIVLASLAWGALADWFSKRSERSERGE